MKKPHKKAMALLLIAFATARCRDFSNGWAAGGIAGEGTGGSPFAGSASGGRSEDGGASGDGRSDAGGLAGHAGADGVLGDYGGDLAGHAGAGGAPDDHAGGRGGLGAHATEESSGAAGEAGEVGSLNGQPPSKWLQQTATSVSGESVCARAIAVGANDVPWILDCKTVSSVYYLERAKSGTPDHWIEVGSGVLELDVNLNGQPWVTAYGKGISYGNFFSSSGHTLSAAWVPITSQGQSDFCLISPLAGVSLDHDTAMTSVFDFQSYHGSIHQFWALGCDRNPFVSVWSSNANWREVIGGTFNVDNSEWKWMGQKTPLRVSHSALFSDASGPTPHQNVWIVADGHVYFYSVDHDDFFEEAHAPSSITAITDHYVVADGKIYRWTGDALGEGFKAWIREPGPPINLTQIAWSQAMTDTSGSSVGPSKLWGIDGAGNIYFEQ